MNFNFKAILSVLLLTVVFAASVSQADQLSFFNGTVIAKTTWLTKPTSTHAKAKLQIELLDTANEAIDLDPALMSVGLMMPAMPGMGTAKQVVANKLDASGNPIAGVFIIANMAFSMSGDWAAVIVITNPDDMTKKDKQQLLMSIP